MSENYPFRNSKLPTDERIADLLSRLTADEKAKMMSHNQAGVPRLGINEYHIGCEIARGFVSREESEPSTVFPQPIGLASTFDTELMENIGRIASDESRYYWDKSGRNRWLCVWGPTVDPERDPRWGRTEEAYGEDVYLAGQMSAAYTRGLAGDDEFYLKTVPTLKHFCANNSEFNRVDGSSNITPKLLREYYYRPFEYAIREGGAASVMTAYNELSGVPACMNPDLQKLLKDEWGLTFVVTDGGDFSQTVNNHHFCHTHAEALQWSLKNGCDTMTDLEDIVYAAVCDGLARGIITEADLDKALTNVFRARFRLGEFDEDCPYNHLNVQVNSEEAKRINRRAADEQICLLKNDGLLPLNIEKFKSGARLAVVGPTADECFKDWYCGCSKYSVTVKDGFENLIGKENVVFDNGNDIVRIKSAFTGNFIRINEDGNAAADSDFDNAAEFERLYWGEGNNLFREVKSGKYFVEAGDKFRAEGDTVFEWFVKALFNGNACADGNYRFKDRLENIIGVDEKGFLTNAKTGIDSDKQSFEICVISKGSDRIAKLASECESVILCCGNDPMIGARECIDRATLELPAHQTELFEAAYENPRMVFMLVSSYPYAIRREKELAGAVISTSHAGDELGNAAAAAVFGLTNPAARLPLTWYKSEYDLPDIADYDIEKNGVTYMYFKGEPLFPFGHGLSYSKFKYEKMEIIPSKIGGCTVNVTVKNISEIDGDEVVQIYFNRVDDGEDSPKKKLCGFKRVNIKAGETVDVIIPVSARSLEIYDVRAEKMITPSGVYKFLAGASSADIRLLGTAELNGSELMPRSTNGIVKAKNFDRFNRASLAFAKSENDWYVLTNDWGGMLFYDGFSAENEVHGVRLKLSAPSAPVKIKITVSETVSAEAEIKCSPSAESFSEYTVEFDRPVNGRFDLRMDIWGICGLYSFELI